jgi:hypothetical protein
MLDKLNPWKTIRRLRAEIADLEETNRLVEQWARDAERQAFYKAEEHFKQRIAHLQAHNDALLQQWMDIDSLTPRPVIILREKP